MSHGLIVYFAQRPPSLSSVLIPTSSFFSTLVPALRVADSRVVSPIHNGRCTHVGFLDDRNTSCIDRRALVWTVTLGCPSQRGHHGTIISPPQKPALQNTCTNTSRIGEVICPYDSRFHSKNVNTTSLLGL